MHTDTHSKILSFGRASWMIIARSDSIEWWVWNLALRMPWPCATWGCNSHWRRKDTGSARSGVIVRRWNGQGGLSLGNPEQWQNEMVIFPSQLGMFTSKHEATSLGEPLKLQDRQTCRWFIWKNTYLPRSYLRLLSKDQDQRGQHLQEIHVAPLFLEDVGAWPLFQKQVFIHAFKLCWAGHAWCGHDFLKLRLN